jgi:hypothetical protein
MAVLESDLVVGPLTPAAGVTTISLDFYFEQASWLEVYKSGSETPLVLNTDYTVTGAGTGFGVVTLAVAANGTDAYSVYLIVPLQRSSDMQLRGGFKSGPFNTELDRLWQAIQGVNTRLGRALMITRTSTSVGALFSESQPDRANRSIVFDAAGASLLLGPSASDIESAQASATVAVNAAAALEAIVFQATNTFTTEAGQQTYTLPYSPGSDRLRVVLNTASLTFGQHYTISGAEVTLIEPVVQGGDFLAITGGVYLPNTVVEDIVYYDSFSLFIADNRTFPVGTIVNVTGDNGGEYVASATTGDLGRTNAGNQEFNVVTDERGYNVKARGAVGDNSTDDTAAFSATTSINKVIPRGTYLANSLPINASSSLVGSGSQQVKLKRNDTGNMLRGADRDGVTISGVTLEMGYATHGSGHGVSYSGDFFDISDISVIDYGSNGTGGGTGVLIIEGSSRSEYGRLSDAYFAPSASSAISIGWLFKNTRYSIASNIQASGVKSGIGYAHELKDDAQFNVLSNLIANDSNVLLAYGQTTAGIDGADYNAVSNVVGDGVDIGWLLGEGIGNLLSGMVYNTTGAPDNTDRIAVSYTGGASNNSAFGVMSFGPADNTVSISGDGNFVEVAAHDTSTNVVTLSTGSNRNFVNVVHPGARNSIEGAIEDNSGAAIAGNTGNVVNSPMTGERIGSLSGYFHDKLGESGATPYDSHRFRKEHSESVLEALMVPGDSGNIAGTSVFDTAGNVARSWYVFGANAAASYWKWMAGGVDDVLRLYSNRAEFSVIVIPPSYSVSELASITPSAGANAFCSDDVGGAVPVFGDGTNWRRCTDRAIVST